MLLTNLTFGPFFGPFFGPKKSLLNCHPGAAAAATRSATGKARAGNGRCSFSQRGERKEGAGKSGKGERKSGGGTGAVEREAEAGFVVALAVLRHRRHRRGFIWFRPWQFQAREGHAGRGQGTPLSAVEILVLLKNAGPIKSGGHFTVFSSHKKNNTLILGVSYLKLRSQLVCCIDISQVKVRSKQD